MTERKQLIHFEGFGTCRDDSYDWTWCSLFATYHHPKPLRSCVKDGREVGAIYGFDRNDYSGNYWSYTYPVPEKLMSAAEGKHIRICHLIFLKSYEGITISETMAPELISVIKREMDLEELITQTHLNPWSISPEAPRIDLKSLPSYKPTLLEKVSKIFAR